MSQSNGALSFADVSRLFWSAASLASTTSAVAKSPQRSPAPHTVTFFDCFVLFSSHGSLQQPTSRNDFGRLRSNLHWSCHQAASFVGHLAMSGGGIGSGGPLISSRKCRVTGQPPFSSGIKVAVMFATLKPI